MSDEHPDDEVASKPQAAEESKETSEEKSSDKGPALVFGASGAQGKAVIGGLIDAGYYPVFGATRDVESVGSVEVSNLGAVLLQVNLADSTSVENVLVDTKAKAIFLVTTTDMPPNSISFRRAEQKECETIMSFFDTLVTVYKKDNLERHVIFSTEDNVEQIVKDLSNDDDLFIKPLADGSIVAHYTGKGRGGEYGIDLTKDVEGITLTLITLPLLHSNFLGFAIPLPNEGKTEWTISAAFGDSVIDMFSVEDLSIVVPAILEEKELYANQNLRLTAEKINLYTIASVFSDIFGKDVIYNPLTITEMSNLKTIPSAPAMAQMCNYLKDKRSWHDIDITQAVMFPRKPQLLKDWLLTHSDHYALEEVGLSMDESPILTVVVFGATGRQGYSVIKGLLADTRKEYKIRATSRKITCKKAQKIKALDPDRITLVQANFDDTPSCIAAADGAEGAFLVTDYFEGAEADPEVEEKHAMNVIDACEASNTVKHLVFSTLESVEEMNTHYKLGLPMLEDKGGRKSVIPYFDAKARAASYARTKKLSCTFVLMPVYAESFFELMAPEEKFDKNGHRSLVISVPKEENASLMCMSVDELGPAVANIFDSYQVYAGHEIGLVTDFVTIEEVAEKISNTIKKEMDSEGNVITTVKVEKKDITIDKWVEKKGTYAQDLGQMFKYFSKTDAVKRRRSTAKTLQLLPDAKGFEEWLEKNRLNTSFREKLGLR